jgi:hypothetical protein
MQDDEKGLQAGVHMVSGTPGNFLFLFNLERKSFPNDARKTFENRPY